GRGSAYSLPEARAALENGVTELVVVPVTSKVAAPAHTRLELAAADEAQLLTTTGDVLELQARARGSWANDARIVVTHRKRARAIVGVDLEILLPGEQAGEGETLQNLQLLPGFTRSLGEILADRSDLLCLDAASSLSLRADEATVVPLTNGGPPQTLLRTTTGIPVMRLRAGAPIRFSMRADADGSTFHLTLTHDDANRTPIPLARSSFNLRAGPLLAHGTVLQGCPDAGALFEVLDGLAEVDVECCLWPAASDRARLTDGKDASAREYIQALDALVDEPDVDLVVAGLQFATGTDAAVLDANKRKARAVYGAIISHCEVMAGESKGRLGFGHVPPGLSVEDVVELADSMVSDRFVL
ncbi:MAG TPA: hypothetical protein PKY30_26050, partial [Myxococcota bacterium]|nr:hypothetical protein [Myxococcota bacterium]